MKRPGKKKVSHQSQEIRLNRFIANAGVCSRREADKLIADGLVKVNGLGCTKGDRE
ncbi:MAG: S4 domain-containing protein, partial [Bacteroidota bacterium]